jgi:hypothetical protein
LFELNQLTKVTWTNVNPRPEFHGEEHVRAIDLSFRIEGSNEMLEAIEPGLLAHHYTNDAAKKGQDKLPGMIGALPNLRHPKLPTTYRYAKDEKPRGYRLEIDHGLGDRNVVLEDCVRGTLGYELVEGGTVRILVTMQYNGDALQDDALHGRLCGLAGEGSGHILLAAPAQPIMVKGTGWRSGKPDTQPPTDNGAPLFQQPPGEDDADVVHPAGSPEAALAGALPPAQDDDPFPNSAAAARARGRKRAGASA